MVLSAVTGVSSPVTVENIPKVESSVTESTVVKQPTRKDIENMMSTEQYIRQYFKDIPIMISIAKCESRFRQLDPDGEILRGVVNKKDVGVMQINEHYHLDQSIEKNYDIYTIEGNTAYARELYEKQGTRPWNYSKACWGKYLPKDSQIALNTK